MNFFAMAGLCSAGMASALLFSPAAVATNADFSSSEAIICVECTSEAAARDVALRHVSQLECDSRTSRPQDDAFCRTFQKRVLLLSPYKNHIYRYMVVAQRDGLPNILREGDSLTAQEQSAYTELMQTFRDLAAFYRDFSKVALRTSVANAAPAPAPDVSALLGADLPAAAQLSCPPHTALRFVNDTTLQEVFKKELIAQSIEAPNSPFGQMYREHLAAKGIDARLTSTPLGLTYAGTGFHVAATWIDESQKELDAYVYFDDSELGPLSRPDSVRMVVKFNGYIPGNNSYSSIDGRTRSSHYVPNMQFTLDVENSTILNLSGLEALRNNSVLDNSCVKKSLATGFGKGKLWAKRAGDGFELMTNRYSVYIPLPVTRLCDTWHNIQPEFAPQWLSSTCKSQNQQRDHRKEP